MATLRKCDRKGNIQGTRLQGARFQGTRFQGTRFQGTRFQGARRCAPTARDRTFCISHSHTLTLSHFRFHTLRLHTRFHLL